MRFSLVLATISISAVALADDTFQVRHAVNLNVGDSFVDFTNSGATEANGASSNLCANVYTFDPQEEMVSCCTCSVTPNALQSLSVLKSLISNTLTPAIPTSVVIKVLATNDTTCSAATAASPAHGLLAWGTTLHQNNSGVVPSYTVTETAFSQAELSQAEFTHITSTCAFILADGSGYGICKGCLGGGLGSSTSTQ